MVVQSICPKVQLLEAALCPEGHTERSQKLAEDHMGLINNSVAPLGTVPSTKWSNYPRHSRGLYSSHSSRGKTKHPRFQRVPGASPRV